MSPVPPTPANAAPPLFLGIEIGGTKLQLGVSAADGGPFVEFRRLAVQPELGAQGILQQIATSGRELVQRHPIRRAGIGFGGPVDAARGQTITSHQITGWDHVPLVEWCRQQLDIPAVLGNDCDVATLAEAQYGAGRGYRSVFYITVGTGVGGGCVLDGQLLGRDRPAIAELGHLRPGIDAVDPHATVEAVASGWGIARTARRAIQRAEPRHRFAIEDLLARCDGDLQHLTAVILADAARAGNALADESLQQACRTLGWAIAQMITLLAPEIVVIGGGVAQIGEALFLRPLREFVQMYAFPPLLGSYQIVPAQLGEAVVVHGAVALAAGPTASAGHVK